MSTALLPLVAIRWLPLIFAALAAQLPRRLDV
jgi:hypothetical protein